MLLNPPIAYHEDTKITNFFLKKDLRVLRDFVMKIS